MDKISEHKAAFVLAIDFGTSRTKAAVWDSENNRIEIFQIGEEEKKYIPSIFHVDGDGDITIGEEANDLLVHDPLGALDNVKLHLDEILRAANAEKVEAVTLLSILLKHIFRIFDLKYLKNKDAVNIHLVLSLPSRWQYEDIYTDAVLATGKHFDQVTFIKEPIAAAHFWKRFENNNFIGHLIVIDYGGGTIDWACLEIEELEIKNIAECPPGGLNGAGLKVDKRIFNLLEQKIKQLDEEKSKELLIYLKENKLLILNYIRKLKERFSSNTQKPLTFIIAGQKISFDPSIFQDALLIGDDQRNIERPFAYILKAHKKIQQPLSCILVGGGSKVAGFRNYFESKLNELSQEENIDIELLQSKELDYATVLGAIYSYLDQHGVDFDKREKLDDKTSKVNLDLSASSTKNFFDPNKI